jgi:hypothetical protein
MHLQLLALASKDFSIDRLSFSPLGLKLDYLACQPCFWSHHHKFSTDLCQTLAALTSFKAFTTKTYRGWAKDRQISVSKHTVAIPAANAVAIQSKAKPGAHSPHSCHRASALLCPFSEIWYGQHTAPILKCLQSPASSPLCARPWRRVRAVIYVYDYDYDFVTCLDTNRSPVCSRVARLGLRVCAYRGRGTLPRMEIVRVPVTCPGVLRNDFRTGLNGSLLSC